ncbi:MAG: hypothetical protein R6V23_04235 [Bacteroidales bacterium]
MIDLKQHSLYKSMEVDSVISAVFNIYLKKFINLFIFSFVAVFIIQLLAYNLGFFEIYAMSENPEMMMREFSGLMGKVGIYSIGAVIIYGILNVFLVSYLLKSDLDPKAQVGDIFMESIRKYGIHMIFFLIISVLIVFFGALLGIIAFIIGSFIAVIYLGTVLFPGGTIVVAEEKNALEAVGRAFTLAHKDFWSALGSAVLFILIMILISIVVAAIMSIPFVIMFFDQWNETGNMFEAFKLQKYDIGMWAVVLNSLVSALIYPLYAIFSVVLYFKLKFTEDNKTVITE